MPPRIPALLAQTISRPSTTIASFLVPFVHLQTRSASILSSLSDNPGAYSTKKKLGRGPSSGKGKTSGRGQKGQKARGKVPKQFNGGQTPEGVVHGKSGFINVHRIELQEVNLDKLQTWINQGRIDASKPITIHEICHSKLVGQVKDGVKLLAGTKGSNVTIQQPIHIVVSRASQSAIEAVEAAGGTVTTRFYTETAVRRVKQGVMHPFISLRWDPAQIGHKALIPDDGLGMTPEERVTGLGFQYRLPDPTGRKELEYYRDARNRGYLSHLVQEGQGPSLFWKPPLSEEQIEAMRKSKGGTRAAKMKEENKLW
ncbi:YmL10 [Lithohypha guttulata]|uniref:YmL10 n=1 Tax=Lithohypha guttulata TaxID=1690604 RepID=A0AAN7YG77_9EURO|nr:YmL10 [Lithohypha guttulata]KAK5103706.1 YmL10 [Lithohypha guttulata]